MGIFSSLVDTTLLLFGVYAVFCVFFLVGGWPSESEFGCYLMIVVGLMASWRRFESLAVGL